MILFRVARGQCKELRFWASRAARSGPWKQSQPVGSKQVALGGASGKLIWLPILWQLFCFLLGI